MSKANVELNYMRDDVKDLVNVLTAYGAGNGLERMTVTRRHEESIAEYGEHHGHETFSDAVDMNDLIEKADAYLAQYAIPQFEISGSAADGEYREGDTVRFASPVDGIAFDIPVVEYGVSVDASGEARARITLGKPPYNPLRVLDEANTDEEENRIQKLDLPTPTNFNVSTASLGVQISGNPFIGNSRASGWEVHISQEPLQDADRSTIVDMGARTTLNYQRYTSGIVYVKGRAYAENGDRGDWTEEWGVPAGNIEINVTIDDIDGQITEVMLDEALQETLTDARTTSNVIEANQDAWNQAVQRSALNEQAIQQTVTKGTYATLTSNYRIKMNADSFNDTEGDAPGELYLHGLDADLAPADVNGSISLNGVTYNLPKGVINPNYHIETGYIVFTLNTGVIWAVRYDPEQSKWYRYNSGKVGHAEAFTLTKNHVFLASIEMDGAENFTSVTVLKEALMSTHFSQIYQDAGRIQTIVAKLDDPDHADQFSAITQLVDEIDLRVKSDEVVTSINLDPSGVRINADKVTFGNFNNLVANADFGFGDNSWFLGTNITVREGVYHGVTPLSTHHLVYEDTIAREARNLLAFEVAGGEEYYVGAYLAKTIAYSGTVTLRLSLRDKNDAEVATVNAFTTNLTTNYESYTGVVVIPNNPSVRKAQLEIGFSGTTTGYAFVGAVSCSKRMSTELIVDGGVTADKMSANVFNAGESFNVGDGSQLAGRLDGKGLRIFDGASEVLRVGKDLSDFSFVPAGVNYGLAGVLGSGIHIQGAPRLIDSGYVNDTLSFPGGSNGDWKSATATKTLTIAGGGNKSIPAGKKWILLVTNGGVDAGPDVIVAGQQLHFRAFRVSNGVPATGELAGGETYNTFELVNFVRVKYEAALAGVNSSWRAAWQVLEVDA